MSWAGGALSDWTLEAEVVDEKLNLNVLNWGDIDKAIPTCCPKNLFDFKSWLVFWLRDSAKKQIAQKAKEEFLKESLVNDQIKSFNLPPNAPGSYKVGWKATIPARVRVPVKFTITTKYKCEDNDENCECTIECEKSKFILMDIKNVPIQPIDDDGKSDSGVPTSWFIPIASLEVPSPYFNLVIYVITY